MHFLPLTPLPPCPRRPPSPQWRIPKSTGARITHFIIEWMGGKQEYPKYGQHPEILIKYNDGVAHFKARQQARPSPPQLASSCVAAITSLPLPCARLRRCKSVPSSPP